MNVHSPYFDTCKQLAHRYWEATNGAARVQVSQGQDNLLRLTYQSCMPAGGAQAYETVFETTLSASAAVDSLIAHLACVLDSNSSSVELASLQLNELGVTSGSVAVQLYCPSWHTPCTIYCVYRSETQGDYHTVTLYPIARRYLDEHQQEGWRKLEQAGIESQLSRILPWTAQVLAQFLELNSVLDTPARMLVLPGEHRDHGPHPTPDIVLDGFDDKTQYWLLEQNDYAVYIETPSGPLTLRTPEQAQMLTTSVARWQTICEALADNVEPPQATTTSVT